MKRSKKSRSEAARKGWATRRRLADGGFRLEVPGDLTDPFRKFLEPPDPKKTRRMFAIVGYTRPSTGYKDQKIKVYMHLKVSLGPMTGAAAAKLRLDDIKREIRDMGLKGKVEKVLAIAALQPYALRKGRRVFTKKSSKKKRGK